MTALAQVNKDLGRDQLAMELMERSVAMAEKLGKLHPVLPNTLQILAGMYRDARCMGEAETALQRVIAIRKEALGPHPITAEAIHQLGELYYHQERWQAALAMFEESNNIILGRRIGTTTSPIVAARRHTSSEVAQYTARFVRYVRASYRLGRAEPLRQAQLRAKAFEMAQWALLTDTSGALAQMSARFSSRDGALAKLVRKRLTNERGVRRSFRLDGCRIGGRR